MIGWPTPYVALLLTDSISALVHRLGESVLAGLTVVNVDVDSLAVPAGSAPGTFTVYLVLNFSAAVDVQVVPSAESVPAIVAEPAVTVTAVTFAPLLAVTTT